MAGVNRELICVNRESRMGLLIGGGGLSGGEGGLAREWIASKG